MTEATVHHLLEVERDFVQLEAAVNDLLRRLGKLPVRRAGAAARDLRKVGAGLRTAYQRLETPIEEAAALSQFLEPAPF